MKTPLCSVFARMALVAGVIGFPGCTREPSHPPPLTRVVMTNVTNAPPAAPPLTNATSVTPVPTAAELQAPTATVAAQRPPLPAVVNEVVDLAQAQVGDSVLLEYIKKAATPFELSADQIIYLKDVGVSEQVLAALVQRSQELSAASAAPVPAPPAVAPAVPGANEVAEAAQAAPAPAPAAAASQPTAPVYAENAPAPAAAPAPAPAPVYSEPVTQVTQNYFYTELAPYGSWVEMPTYGWCWRPTVAVVDPYWRPYCHGGRWLYTDCGWYWQSTYTWGWAPFHYGTWYRSPACGWVWHPGSTWAPAWVTWRYTDSHCGWAPLPPGCGWGTSVGLTFHGSRVSVGFSFGLGWDCFNFVHYQHFDHAHPYRYCLPHHETTVVYNRSTVINNYIRGSHNTIVNKGLAPTRISAVTRRDVRKVEIRDVTGEPDAPRRAERLEREGRQLAVYRPRPTTDANGSPTLAARRPQATGKSVAPGRPVSPSTLAEGTSRADAPVATGSTRSDNVRPARTTAATRGSGGPETVPAQTSTPAAAKTPPPSAAPQSGGQAARAATSPQRVRSSPAGTAAGSQPSRMERVPPARASTPPASNSPSGSPASAVPSPQAQPATSSRVRTSERPTTVNPSSSSPAMRSVSRPAVQPPTATQTESSRSESRRGQPAGFGGSGSRYSMPERSVYGAGSPPVSVPSAPRMSTPPVREYQAPGRSSSARSGESEYRAPSRSESSRSSAPSYSAPSRSSSSPSGTSAPRREGNRSRTGQD